VALYFREDAPLIGPPSSAARGSLPDRSVAGASAPAHELLRARLLEGPCFFTDLLAELDLPAVAVREALFDLVWSGDVTNDSWAPLREPHLAGSSFARASSAAGAASGGGEDGGSGGEGVLRPRLAALRSSGRPAPGRARFAARRARVGAGGFVHPPGRWSLAEPVFRSGAEPSERRRVLAELLLERYGIVTREQVLAERIEGGFAALYGTFCDLETLGVCRRGYFVEGLGGAQFALPGAVERLRARRPDSPPPPAGQSGERQPVAPGGERTLGEHPPALVLAASDPAQPYGAALPWPRPNGREGLLVNRHRRRPARVPGAYVVLLAGAPVLYVERGGRGLITLATGAGRSPIGADERVQLGLRALAEAVHAGRIGRLAFERIDGEPAVGSQWETLLANCGFRLGPRRLTLSA
jgi:ATP-dependent Lhr-like helicase